MVYLNPLQAAVAFLFVWMIAKMSDISVQTAKNAFMKA